MYENFQLQFILFMFFFKGYTINEEQFYWCRKVGLLVCSVAVTVMYEMHYFYLIFHILCKMIFVTALRQTILNINRIF